MPLTAAELEALATSPAAASGDQGSATARSADDIKTLLALAADAALDTAPNPNGGRKSAWRQTRPARAVPPGAV